MRFIKIITSRSQVLNDASLNILHAAAFPAFQAGAHQSELLFFDVLLFLLDVGNLQFLNFDIPAETNVASISGIAVHVDD